MNYYQFVLPLETNDGASYAEALGRFTREAVRLAGGITIGPDMTGAWVDDDGKLYLDKVRGYYVACDTEKSETLLQFAYETFPDQKALFVANIGAADIFAREAYEAAGNTRGFFSRAFAWLFNRA